MSKRMTIVVFVGFGLLACGALAMFATPPPEPTVPVAPTAPVVVTPEPTDPPQGATLAGYDAIAEGDNYETVVAKVGGDPGEIISESEFGGSKYVIVMWPARVGFGNMTLSFTNGLVTSKAQTGLQ